MLKAYDTAAQRRADPGIYLDELVGAIGPTVWTAGERRDLGDRQRLAAHGQRLDPRRASTRHGTTNDDAEVLGQTIDIDANGGSIGAAGNDLEIDSSRGSPPPCVNVELPG